MLKAVDIDLENGFMELLGTVSINRASVGSLCNFFVTIRHEENALHNK